MLIKNIIRLNAELLNFNVCHPSYKNLIENIFTNLLINLKHLQNVEPEEKKSPEKEKNQINQIWQSEKITFQSAVKKKIKKNKIIIAKKKKIKQTLLAV